MGRGTTGGAGSAERGATGRRGGEGRGATDPTASVRRSGGARGATDPTASVRRSGGGRGATDPTPAPRRSGGPERFRGAEAFRTGGGGRGLAGDRPPPGDRGPGREKGAGGEQVEGRRAVREALLAGRRRIREVWMDGALEPAPVLDEIIKLAERAGVPVRMTPKIDQLSRTDAAQGVIARGDPLPLAVDDELLADPKALLLALDGVTDPRNLGAILRTAEGAGATGVILPRRRSVHVTPAVTKAAAGAVEHLPIALVSGIPALLERAGRAGVWAVGLDERGPGDLFSLELATEPVVLVLGAEGRGLSRLARERCDVLVRIPMLGRVSSLNVATAASLAAYEVARRRQGSATQGV
ncbi:MAG TPA: 23S rRNA (guanosine(2251)-2'-O)-methyltransferase RlmB [Acidimicrobiia bacterium]|nr:23S rRNA (guanosine(2251)-2'-O)-methyltransferase RlmB [Acidimicrobiia bacterium]